MTRKLSRNNYLLNLGLATEKLFENADFGMVLIAYRFSTRGALLQFAEFSNAEDVIDWATIRSVTEEGDKN